MKNYNAILIEKLQKILILSSGKFYKYEYLTGEEKLLSNQQQTKTIKNQGEKQIEAIEDNKKQLANINNDYKNKLLL